MPDAPSGILHIEVFDCRVLKQICIHYISQSSMSKNPEFGSLQTNFRTRLSVRIQGSHPWGRGSIPRFGIFTHFFFSSFLFTRISDLLALADSFCLFARNISS